MRICARARAPGVDAAGELLVREADARVEDVDAHAVAVEGAVVVLVVGAGAAVDAVDAPRGRVALHRHLAAVRVLRLALALAPGGSSERALVEALIGAAGLLGHLELRRELDGAIGFDAEHLRRAHRGWAIVSEANDEAVGKRERGVERP